MKKLGFGWYNSICCAKDANNFFNFIIQLFQEDKKNVKIRHFSMNNIFDMHFAKRKLHSAYL
jgi:hypothetical protein